MSEQEYLFYLKAVRSYKIGRNFPLLFMAFTIGSLITTFLGYPCIINVFASTMFFIFGQEIKSVLIEEGNTALLANCGLLLFIIIGVIIFALFFILYLLAKKKRRAYLAQTILFCIDTVLVLIFEMGFTTFFFDLILHVILVAILIKGYAHSKKIEGDFDEGVATTEADVTEIYNMLKKLEKANTNK